VTDYRTTTGAILKLLEDNKTVLGAKHIAEAGETIDFNMQTPFIYVHFDLDQTVSQNCGVVILTVDLFCGDADKNISEAKANAIELTGKVAQLLDEVPVFYEDSPLELFAEYTNKAIIRLQGKTQIRFGI